MPRPVHFEISADDPNRASTFYQSVFGWKVEKWDGPMPYWLFTTGQSTEPGIDGGMMMRSPEMQMPNCNTVGVPSLDDFIAKVEAGGGKVVVPKMEIPGVGWLAYCTDTEGNWFGMMQRTG